MAPRGASQRLEITRSGWRQRARRGVSLFGRAEKWTCAMGVWKKDCSAPAALTGLPRFTRSGMAEVPKDRLPDDIPTQRGHRIALWPKGTNGPHPSAGVGGR